MICFWLIFQINLLLNFSSKFLISVIILHFLKSKSSFYWSKISLQYCVSFCHTTKWIMYMHTCTFSLFSHLLNYPYPTFWVITEHRVELLVLYRRFLIAIYFTLLHYCTFQLQNLHLVSLIFYLYMYVCVYIYIYIYMLHNVHYRYIIMCKMWIVYAF